MADLSEVTTADGLAAVVDGRTVFGLLVQYPDLHGRLRDHRALAAAAHESGALVTAAAGTAAILHVVGSIPALTSGQVTGFWLGAGGALIVLAGVVAGALTHPEGAQP